MEFGYTEEQIMVRETIRDFAENPELFSWRKEKFFGSLFQKVVAQRL